MTPKFRGLPARAPGAASVGGGVCSENMNCVLFVNAEPFQSFVINVFAAF